MTILKPLRDFADGLELTLTLPLIDTLLLAASHPDKGIDDFARMAGVRPGTMSRWLQDLSDIDRRGKPGLALQLPFLQVSESMGNHDSKIVDAASVD
jgi:hypothetical protein